MSDGSDTGQKVERYTHFSESLDKALNGLGEMQESDLEDAKDKTAPNAHHAHRMELEEGTELY